MTGKLNSNLQATPGFFAGPYNSLCRTIQLTSSAAHCCIVTEYTVTLFAIIMYIYKRFITLQVLHFNGDTQVLYAAKIFLLNIIKRDKEAWSGSGWGGGGVQHPPFNYVTELTSGRGRRVYARLSIELSELRHDEAQDVETKRYYDYQLMCLAVCSL